MNRECNCGSNLPKRAAYDARRIFLCYVCDKCEAEKLSHYRQDVLVNPNYEATEEIEDDY